MHEVLVNRLGGLSLPRKSVVRLTDRPDMTLDVYRGRKTIIQPTLFLIMLHIWLGHLVTFRNTFLELNMICFDLLFISILRFVRI